MRRRAVRDRVERAFRVDALSNRISPGSVMSSLRLLMPPPHVPLGEPDQVAKIFAGSRSHAAIAAACIANAWGASVRPDGIGPVSTLSRSTFKAVRKANSA